MDDYAVVAEDVRPRIDTIQVFEQDGDRFRIFITIGGGVAVEKWGEQKGTWSHVPLRQASQQDISDVLAARYQTEDEEIARSLAGYGS